MRQDYRSTSTSSMSSVTDEIKARIDLVELIGRSVSLKRVGSAFRGLCPFQGSEVKFALNCRFDDAEVRRDVKVARNEQRMVPDVHNFIDAARTVQRGGGAIFDAGKDGIVHFLEGLCDERGADRTGRITAPERDHAAAKSRRDWWGR